MADVFSAHQRSRIMAAVRSRKNRSTEMMLVAALRAQKVKGWRRHYPILGQPDFAFPRARLVIFVDGCFWHACPRCGSIPESNRPYWTKKILGNVKRDRMQRKILRSRGWFVMRIWEHDLRGAALPRIIKRIEAALARRSLKPQLTIIMNKGQDLPCLASKPELQE